MTKTEIERAAPRVPDRLKIAYQLPQAYGVKVEILIKDALDPDCDERLWVPQGEGVAFRPLVMSASHGYFVNILRVRKAGVLSRHRHAGPVVATTLRGKWRYLEHDWIAEEGDLAFEPPGEVHTLVVPDDVAEMMTLFHVTGGYIYVDPFGEALAYEDVFTKIAAMRRHFDAVGLGAAYADRFIV
ncbi:2,4'-dihydroxyacetophenone dioxygenase family protein [Ensifer soli]|uniref:2,4'-dihydroxyacetophenone dioxygenase family protein n=1 Tax=Ciceribacter sp. sgz301302 TaxID=3342379 RepID=UPI0035BAD984